VETQGTDVKMYTVGPEYGHAEARKSPAVDGKVQRNKDGKEVRFPVILTLSEKEIARRIVLGFKQFVCGFDLLRVQEGHNVVSYVCDVNGWSFVKNSRKYYDDCSQILTEHILAAVRPEQNLGFSTVDPLLTSVEESSLTGMFRRFTEKNKKETQTPRSDNNSVGSANVAATTLQDGAIPVREIPGHLVSEPASLCTSTASSSDDLAKLARMKRMNSYENFSGVHKEELRCVIAVVRHGDRTPKQKLKVKMREPRILQYFRKHCKDPTKDLKVKAKAPMTEFLATVKAILASKNKTSPFSDKQAIYKLRHMRDILERWKIAGLNRKLQIKPQAWEEDEETGIKSCTEAQLILKWGGNLTKLGET
jgi:inositol hexakisphosphate/diphosphoinositol-pentakisphosphate kinase